MTTEEKQALLIQLDIKKSNHRRLTEQLETLSSEINRIEYAIKEIERGVWNKLHSTHIDIGDTVIISEKISLEFLNDVNPKYASAETSYLTGSIAVIKAINTETDTIHLSCDGIHRHFPAYLIRDALRKVAQS